MGTSDSRRKLWAQRTLNGLCVYCGKNPPIQERKGCEPCLREKVEVSVRFSRNNKAAIKQYGLLLKHQVIEKYGGKCTCCEEANVLFLTIDHINNDGNQDRMRLYGRKNAPTSSWYLKLRREELRNDLQVLCFNCNFGKSVNCGVCPHQLVNRMLLPVYDRRHDPQFDVRLKIVWPADDDLIAMCNDTSVTQVSKDLNVDFTAISGRLERRNKYHLVKKRTGGSNKGETNPAAKLTSEMVQVIRKKYAEGIRRKLLSQEYSVSVSTIDKIVANQIWKEE